MTSLLREWTVITNRTAWRPHRWSQERWCWRQGISWLHRWSTCWRRGKRVPLWRRRWRWRWERGCRSGTWTAGEDKGNGKRGVWEDVESLVLQLMLLDICRVIRLERMNCASVPLQASGEIMSVCMCVYHLSVCASGCGQENLHHRLGKLTFSLHLTWIGDFSQFCSRTKAVMQRPQTVVLKSLCSSFLMALVV